jgi:hypothetical protein
VVNCSMELGGNAPFLVFDDADIPAAVEGAMLAKMRNGGEACTAANRFYVHEAVADEFTSALTKRMSGLAVGPGLDESTEVGPLVNQPTRTKVATLVDESGARVVTGGQAPDRRGYFYEPTVLDRVPSDAPILATEIFGPVAPIVRFSSEEEAVKWANSTEYGLVSYVYTQDLRRGLRVSEALESGMVGLNRGLVSDPAARVHRDQVHRHRLVAGSATEFGEQVLVPDENRVTREAVGAGGFPERGQCLAAVGETWVTRDTWEEHHEVRGVLARVIPRLVGLHRAADQPSIFCRHRPDPHLAAAGERDHVGLPVSGQPVG